MTGQKSENNYCSHCKRYFNRALSIDALIVHEGKILLIYRLEEPYKNCWAIPGGHVDYNETVEDAVVREVKEETNLSVTKLKFFNIYSSPSRHPLQTVAVAYVVDAVGTPQAGSDASRFEYWSLNALPSPLAFDHQKIIADYRLAVSHSTGNS